MKKLQKKTFDLIGKANQILEEYKKKGIKITVRGLFYQLVTRDLIPNNQKSYQKLSRVLSTARYEGLMDWDSIVDNANFLHICNFFDNVTELLDVAKKSYKLDRWSNQKYYVEVWVEKDALRNIAEPITNNYQVNLFIPGGRVSTTMLYEATQRFAAQEDLGKKCILLYLGDHDPCGLDMALRDIPSRLDRFGTNIEVKHIALTMEQIKEYNIPTDQISKDKDRTKEWYEELAETNKCWELDAIKPTVLQEIIKQNILHFLDIDKYEDILRKEKEDIKSLEAQQ